MCIFLRQGCDDTMVQCRRPPAPRVYSLGNNPAARWVCTRQVDRATLRTGWSRTSSSDSKPSCCRISTPRTRWRGTSCATITTRRTWCRRPTCVPSSTSTGFGEGAPRRTTAARGCSRSCATPPTRGAAAIAQIRPTKGEYAANLQKIGGVLAQLAKLESRVDLVIFPETSTSGYFVEGGVRDVAVTAGTLFRQRPREQPAAPAPPPRRAGRLL